MPHGGYRFRRSFGNVNSRFRGARRDTFPLFTGLLDDFGGAAFAASLRLLNRDFQNEGIVGVRRASDSDIEFVKVDKSFAQPLITLNSPLVGSSATFGDFISGTDGFVTDWIDQATIGGNDATQATTTQQPKIVSAGSLVVGGLDFDGVDDCMSVIGDPVITASFSGTYSTFGVQTIATGEDGYMYGNASGTNGNSLYARSTPAYSSSNANAAQPFDEITRASGQNLLSSVYNNGDAGLLVNSGGTMTDQGTYDFAAGTSDFIIGNRNGGGAGATFLDGQIQEIIVYNLNQSANRAAIEAEMIANYSIS